MDREDGNSAGPDSDIAAARPTEGKYTNNKLPVPFISYAASMVAVGCLGVQSGGIGEIVIL